MNPKDSPLTPKPQNPLEIVIAKRRSSLASKLSARPSKSLVRMKSIKRSTALAKPAIQAKRDLNSENLQG